MLLVTYLHPSLPTDSAEEPKITNGIINSTSGLANDIRYLQFSAPIQSGNSGGPLIDESGAVIGIITATLNPKYLEMIGSSEPQNVNFAIKSNLLIDILEQAGISYTTPNQNQKRTASEIADEADGYTARVLCWK
jgi:S1-C subfamily serine protease